MGKKVTAFLVTVGLASSVWGAMPFGSFGGLVSGTNGASGVVGVHGWCLDDDGVAYVDIYVDGVIVGRADYGRNRPGVAQMYPGYPDSDAAGFGFLLDTTRFPNGTHTISAKCVSLSGEQVWLQQKEVEFTNTSNMLKPFGEITFPEADVEMKGVCDLTDPNRRYAVISGWVLDLGLTPEDNGVGYVELMIDGVIHANTRLHCTFDPLLGGFTNCYGLESLDVFERYPMIFNATHAGFRFVIDVGVLISSFGLSEGNHHISIRAGDISDQVSEIANMNVVFKCAEPAANEESFGAFDILGGLMQSGLMEIEGWALDWEGVNHVEVWVDGMYMGNATYGTPRPDISASFPGYPDSAAPGFVFVLDTTLLSDGEHEVAIRVVDAAGEPTIIGVKSFVVLNNPM